MTDPVHAVIRCAVSVEDDFALRDDLMIQDIPNMDSLAQVRLVMEIEKILDDKLGMNEMLSLDSVASIRQLLKSRGK
jgi:acyl carrier protein